jgi:hypothetical protein
VRQQRRELLLEIDEHAGDEHADDVVSQALLQAGLLIRVPAPRMGVVSSCARRVVRIG